jgi:hypothetical protein
MLMVVPDSQVPDGGPLDADGRPAVDFRKPFRPKFTHLTSEIGLGDFSPTGWLFTLGCFLTGKSSPINLVHFSWYRRLCIKFDKKWVGLHFGRFFHKPIWSPWI